jgi:uncharacterized membrane protein
MKAKPKESAVLLRLGLMFLLVGVIASVISPYSPAQLFAAFLSIGMFSLGSGFGYVLFSIRMKRLEKQAPIPPPPPP